MTARIRINEGAEPQPQLLWDSIWDSDKGLADWALAGPSKRQNQGGLQATKAIHSAVILCLFTDRRVPDKHPLRKYLDDSDARGWWGDGVDVRADLFETDMGSLLWTLARAPLDADILRWVDVLTREALQVLIRQGVAARIDVQAIGHFDVNRVDMTVQIYARDGSRTYDHRFDDIWKQVAA